MKGVTRNDMPDSWPCRNLFAAALVFAGTVALHAGAADIPAASVETDPVSSTGDAADDPCIWVHPQNPELSLIIGTDKQAGLAVYGLDGSQLAFLPCGEVNNVDVRYDFPLGGQGVDLVVAGNQTGNVMAVYRVNPELRTLDVANAEPLPLGIEVYGSCLYHSRRTGKFYAIFNSRDGEVEQWELEDDGDRHVGARLVRSFDVGDKTEGCVADDAKGVLYIGEEETGIWRYPAEPDGGLERVLVDATGPTGHLTADVEGLTIYYAGDDDGYLIASSQGNSTFVVYDRAVPNEYLCTFAVGEGGGIDAVTGTDGIDVCATALNSTFPSGLFVVQDDKNDGGNQNFKLVPWEAIANSAVPNLSVVPSWTPRVNQPPMPASSASALRNTALTVVVFGAATLRP